MLTLTIASLLSLVAQFGYALTPIEQQYNFELRNKATAMVSVALSNENGATIYRYSMRNNANSERGIISLKLQLGVDPSSMRVEAPSAWRYSGCCTTDNKREGASGIKVAGWLYSKESAILAPGNALSGFTVIASTATIPGIKKYFVESDATNDMPDCQEICGDENEDRRVAQFTDFFNNSTSGLTLGPDPLPVVIDLPALIDRLITLKHQAASLGWLGNAKFVLKLDKRLDQAKAALARDKKKLVRVRLSQFVHELTKARKDREDDRRGKDKDDYHDKDRDDHRRKKFVNDEAFQLLKINADFIIAKLPAKAKDKDEDDECRRAEGEREDDDRKKDGKPGKGRGDD